MFSPTSTLYAQLNRELVIPSVSLVIIMNGLLFGSNRWYPRRDMRGGRVTQQLNGPRPDKIDDWRGRFRESKPACRQDKDRRDLRKNRNTSRAY